MSTKNNLSISDIFDKMIYHTPNLDGTPGNVGIKGYRYDDSTEKLLEERKEKMKRFLLSSLKDEVEELRNELSDVKKELEEIKKLIK